MSAANDRYAALGRRLALIAFLFIPLLCALAACYSQVDEIRMTIDKNEKGVLVALVSAPVSHNDPHKGEEDMLDANELRDSSGYQELNGMTEQLSRCAISNRIFQRRARVRLDLRAPFEDADELNSVFSCGAQMFDEPAVSFERHDGFLWNTYVIQFEVTQRSERCDGECDETLNFFPRVLTLTVPGKVDQMTNLSNLVGFTVHSRQIDDDSIRIDVRRAPPAEYRAANQRYFQGRAEASRRDVLRIRIVSTELNYNLNTIVSVIGLIFGSGVLYQLGRWLFFRKPKDAEPEPIKRRTAKKRPRAEAPASAAPLRPGSVPRSGSP